MKTENSELASNNQSPPRLLSIPRPNVGAHDNPLMHFLGKVIRATSNTILYWFDKGQFHADQFRINHIHVEIDDLPEIFDSFRIVQISDIHLGTWMNSDRLTGVVDLVNQQTPDLICITGDFITHELQGIFSDLRNCLCNLNAVNGVLAVLGNHDYWSNVQMIRATLDYCGIQELENRVISIRKGDEEIYIAGLDDVYNSKDQLTKIVPQIPPGRKAILLVHVPDYADVAAETGLFSFQLSGHSHGGQIRLPKLGPLVLPPLARKYVRGRYQIKQMIHYTNSGVGTATIPFRYNCPPEIAVIELHPGEITSFQEDQETQ